MDRFTVTASAVAGVGLLAVVAAAAMTPAPSTPPPPVASAPAPDFALATASGATFRLSEHRGEVVVLNLWATWCPPCRHEIPDFVELYDEYRDDGLTVVGVSLDEDGWDAVRPFAEEMGVTYPVAVDDGTVDGLYGPTVSLPTTFVIDREGNVAHYVPGMILRDDLEPLLRPLLDADPTPSETASS
ncbi:TlpA disulfide reductase family protein [Rubrivirga marina]|uniref:TlpA disulfide reductase family protein n=1 Tax=Rubrivirga marina TaxID=1196024 RepID=UPI000BA9A6E9|nr:TlpA disulfide reductase family protein [Rubrivirga marina]